MKKLKIILLFSLIIILGIRFYYNYNYFSIYNNGNNEIKGIVDSIKVNDTSTSIILKSKENILVKYYDSINIKIGDLILVKGTIKEPNGSKVFNLFNYKKYLLSKNIYKLIEVSSIEKIGESNNILYKIKNIIIERLNSINNAYLNMLILADNRVDDKIYESYQINGVVHLFSISGMHINLFSLILLKIFNMFFKDRRISYILTIIFLLGYMIIINTPSIIRSVLLFSFIYLCKIFKIKMKTLNILILILYLMLLINPNYIYDIGFQYSFLISFILIKYNYIYNKKNYIYKLILISLISTLVSFPITINNNFYINILSPICNLIFVPFVSLVIFPISLLVFIFPVINPLLSVLIDILEYLSLLFNKYSLILNFSYMNIYMIIIYYIIILSLLKNIKKIKIIILIIFLIIHYNIHLFNYTNNITMIDVGQGDSFLIELKNKEVILIDTGGNKYYDLATNIIIPYLNSIGIRKIDKLILSHGDFDHIGSALSLINNFNIKSIYMNSGNDNELENEIIKQATIKNISINKINRLKVNISGNIFYFLNNINIEENKDSLIMYTNLNNYGILFMGDSTKEEELEILNNYELDVDILKIGHHGSNTSSGDIFINNLKPRYALVSVGLNNRYNHPSKNVVDILKRNNVNTYYSSINGSVRFILKDNITIYTTMSLPR